VERRGQREAAGPPNSVLALSDENVFTVLDQVLEMQCPLVDRREDVADRRGHGLEAADRMFVNRRFEEDIGWNTSTLDAKSPCDQSPYRARTTSAGFGDARGDIEPTVFGPTVAGQRCVTLHTRHDAGWAPRPVADV